MKHLGDITKIHGYDAPRVEVVIGGSPCQDLSVAGLKAGLIGERSGLFMEQIRIIKEMRERDKANGRTDTDVYPRYMVWENVPGAFSSNKGEDFRTVLEETARIAEETVSVPRYEGGRWANAGAIIGDGWSIAWRLHDAQYWGVPQRRKRISLVADFGGLTAPEILFESESLSGDTEPGGEAGKETAGDTGGRAETASTFQNTGRGWWNESDIGATLRTPRGGDAVKANLVCIPEISRTLSARYDSSSCVDRGQEFILIENHNNDSRVKIREDGVCQTLSSYMGGGGNNVPMVMKR